MHHTTPHKVRMGILVLIGLFALPSCAENVNIFTKKPNVGNNQTAVVTGKERAAPTKVMCTYASTGEHVWEDVIGITGTYELRIVPAGREDSAVGQYPVLWYLFNFCNYESIRFAMSESLKFQVYDVQWSNTDKSGWIIYRGRHTDLSGIYCIDPLPLVTEGEGNFRYRLFPSLGLAKVVGARFIRTKPLPQVVFEIEPGRKEIWEFRDSEWMRVEGKTSSPLLGDIAQRVPVRSRAEEREKMEKRKRRGEESLGWLVPCFGVLVAGIVILLLLRRKK